VTSTAPAGARHLRGGAPGLERRLDVALQRVHELSVLALRVRGQRREVLHQRGDGAGLAAQELVGERLEVAVGGRRGELRLELRAKRVDGAAIEDRFSHTHKSHGDARRRGWILPA
jgi:hypothetical protein